MNLDQDIVDRQYQAENFDDFLADLVTEIKVRNYRITRIINIDNIYIRLEAGIEGTANFERYKIVEFCNLNSCSELVSGDMRAGVFMPPRLVVYQKNKRSDTHILYLKPTAFAALFDSKSLMRAATEYEEDMIDVLEEMAY